MHSDGEIDRKRLRALVARVNALHSSRLEALLSSATSEQRTVLEALPVLIHANHAALPGFVDFDTPAGIDGYTPTEAAVDATRKLALSFTLERFRERVHDLRSLFIVVPESDRERALDVWVIAARARAAALEQKLRGIAVHARRVELELRFRVVDPLDARNPKAAADVAIPRLALERFYRDGVRLAGRIPLWWLVPPELDDRYAQYAERLLSQRHVKPEEVVDLGGLATIPIEECLDAAVTALEETQLHPFRSLPILTLIESYLDGGPPLARRCKAHVHGAGGDAAIDAAMLVHGLIEDYLAPRDFERLALVRQCFVEERRREQVDAAAASWHWPAAERRHLCARPRWRFSDFLAQDLSLRRSLESSRTALAQRLQASTRGDLEARLDAIGARLLRPSNDRAIVGFLSDDFLPAQAQVRLTLRPEAGGWRLDEADAPVHEARRLTGIGLFLHAHGLSIARVQVAQSATRVRLARLMAGLELELAVLADDAVLLVVNAEEIPTGARAHEGEALVTDRDDALDFSGFRTSLVEAIDVVVRRAGVFEVTSAIGNDCVRSAIAQAAAAPTCTSICVDPSHARVIEERIAELIAQARNALDAGACFVFGVATTFVLLEPGRPVQSRAFATYAALADHLRTHGRRAPIRVDARNEHIAALARSTPAPPADRSGAPSPAPR